MSSIGLKAVAGLAISASCSLLLAASAAIGVATTEGNLFIDNAKTAGNATVFEGETLETQLPTQLRLKSGAFVSLSNASRGRIFSSYLELERGSARLRGFSVQANGLHIRPEADATYSVEMKGAVVEVAAMTGNVHVFNWQGVNVANLMPGRALDLRPQEAGAVTPSSLVGCVQKSGDIYTLTDETSNVTVQLAGATNIQAGHRYQVTGTIPPNGKPAGGATQLINVTSARDVGGQCHAAGEAAAATGAAGAAGAAGAGGAAAAGAAAATIGAGTAIIAGVVAAVAVGAAAGVAASGGGNASGAPAGCTANGLSPCSSI